MGACSAISCGLVSPSLFIGMYNSNVVPLLSSLCCFSVNTRLWPQVIMRIQQARSSEGDQKAARTGAVGIIKMTQMR